MPKALILLLAALLTSPAQAAPQSATEAGQAWLQRLLLAGQQN